MMAYTVGGDKTSTAASTGSALKATGDSKLPYLTTAPPIKLRMTSLATKMRSSSSADANDSTASSALDTGCRCNKSEDGIDDVGDGVASCAGSSDASLPCGLAPTDMDLFA